jgi:hypothetical protein
MRFVMTALLFALTACAHQRQEYAAHPEGGDETREEFAHTEGGNWRR